MAGAYCFRLFPVLLSEGDSTNGVRRRFRSTAFHCDSAELFYLRKFDSTAKC